MDDHPINIWFYPRSSFLIYDCLGLNEKLVINTSTSRSTDAAFFFLFQSRWSKSSINQQLFWSVWARFFSTVLATILSKKTFLNNAVQCSTLYQQICWIYNNGCWIYNNVKWTSMLLNLQHCINTVVESPNMLLLENHWNPSAISVTWTWQENKSSRMEKPHECR